MVAEQIFVHINSAAVHVQSPVKCYSLYLQLHTAKKKKQKKKNYEKRERKQKKHAPRKEWDEKVNKHKPTHTHK